MRVPYKGTGPALPDLLAGRVHMIFEPMVTRWKKIALESGIRL